MRTILLSLCILLIGISAFAGDHFTDTTINDLQVYETDKAQGTAWLTDQADNEVVVAVGDMIGIEEAVVVKIDNASITVRSGKSRTKMPIAPKSVFTQDAISDKPLLPFGQE